MTRTILALAVVLSGSAFLASDAQAGHRDHGWGVSVGFGFGGGFVQGFFGHSHRPHCAPATVVAPPMHVHHRIPVYRQLWVPARYESVFAGYDSCGRPIYRTLCVSYGRYESVLASYRCECGYRF